MSDQPEIAIVSASDTRGGAEAHTIALARGLLQRGHRARLYGRCPGWVGAGLPVTDLELGPKWSKRDFVRNVLAAANDRRQLRCIPASATYYLQFKREQISFTRELSHLGRVVWTEHGRWIGGPAGRALRYGYERASQYVTKIICVSDAVAADLSSMVAPEKLMVIPNAVDTSKFSPSEPNRRAALRTQFIPEGFDGVRWGLIASRLHSGKGHDRAIAAALQAGLNLLVVGDGPDRARLEATHAQSGRVLFLGWRDDIADIMAAVDVYLYSGGPTDGMPIVVLEALASGLPVVGFAGDPGDDLIERCGGAVLPAAATFAPADLEKLLNGWSSAGREHVLREHGLDRWVERFAEVLVTDSRAA